MPNIKIFGLKSKRDNYPSVVQNEIKNKLIEMFKKTSYADNIVITMIESTVESLNGGQRPYIQLEFTIEDCKYFDKIIEKLKTLDMDIQLLKINKFIETSQV